jgi:hypothetical protein
MVLIVAATAAAMFVHEAQAYEVVPVAGGGTLAGKIVFNGSVPTKKIIPTKDPQVCGGIRDVSLIVVGADKGVRHAVAYLKKVVSGKDWVAAEPQMTPVLDQEKCQFAPHVQVIRRGSLDIINSDPILHNTHGFYGKRTAFNLAMPNQNETITADLKRPGLVRIECDAHGWMLAWVHVADSPYYAVTGEDGVFTITDIPPGEYTLVVWQEFTGVVEQPVVVRAGETIEMSIEIKKM